MGKIMAVCTSEKRGTVKRDRGKCRLIENYGLEGDAHAGSWHRQVSLLAYERIRDFNREGANVSFGDFGENLVVEGFDLNKLPVGSMIFAGGCVLEVTQIGKECHSECEIARRTGKCIMPSNGIFARVLKGGTVSVGDEVSIRELFSAAAVTVSDSGYAGVRADDSGPLLAELLSGDGFKVDNRVLIPDDRERIISCLENLADNKGVHLIITTGGTGLSKRDNTPEATMAVSERIVPGIAEELRRASMAYTPRAMLGRGVCVIRGNALIINFPGSPKAVRQSYEIVKDVLRHALGILNGTQKG